MDIFKLKQRVLYLLAIVFTIALGLASRKFGSTLPPFLAENAGDALWAAMVYFGFRLIFINKSVLTSICLAGIFSFTIEFSQLYQADWINHLRATRIGALELGQGFLKVDLVRYAVGIFIAAALDTLFRKVEHRAKNII